MTSSLSRSAAWLFTTRKRTPDEVVAALDDKTELRELKVEREEFHGEWNYVIRSRMEQR
jgi:hypothetical protein